MTFKPCIICQLKNLGPVHSVAILVKLCTDCQLRALAELSVDAPRFTPQQARYDDKNNIVAVNGTLKPKYHSVDPDIIYNKWCHDIKVKLREDTKFPAMFKGIIEYHKSGVMHIHGYIAARPKMIAKLSAYFRTWGNTKVNEVTDLNGWEEYMAKAHTEDNYPIILLTN